MMSRWEIQTTLKLFLLLLTVIHGQMIQEMIDLTHELNEDTIYWPTAMSFKEHNKIYEEGGVRHAIDSFCAAEHGGTHIDAPVHFSQHGKTTSEIPLENLIVPGIVVNVSQYTAVNDLYLLEKEELIKWEKEHGTIPDNAVILINFGWAKHWNNKHAYLGGVDASSLRFPGVDVNAAKWIVNHGSVSGIGLDTASVDFGPSSNYLTHQVLAGANLYGLENLNNLDKLPPKGFTVLVMPMKIEGGSGGPCRVVALIDDDGDMTSRTDKNDGCTLNFPEMFLLLSVVFSLKIF